MARKHGAAGAIRHARTGAGTRVATPCAGGLWNLPPSPKLPRPGGARCRRRFRAGRRRRGPKEAGRGIPENPAWTRPGFRPAPVSALRRVRALRVRSPGRPPPSKWDRSRHAAEAADTRSPSTLTRPTPPCPLSRAMRRVVHGSMGDAPNRPPRATRGAGARTLGRGPGVAMRRLPTSARRPPRTRAPPERGGGRRMSIDRAAPSLSSGPRHPDPPPAAGHARSGAEHKLR